MSPLPPLYNAELMAEALSYLGRHHFPLHCYSHHLQTTLFYGGGDFVVRLLHKSHAVVHDLWQTLYVYGLLSLRAATLCFGFIAVTSDLYKRHKNYAYDYAVECIPSSANGRGILGVALDDFENVRKFSGSPPGKIGRNGNRKHRLVK